MQARSKTPELCLIMPVYNEQEIVGEVLRAWSRELDRLRIAWEAHVYNDGSRDGSLAVLQRCAAENGRIVAHDKPNSGHGPTILAAYRELCPRSAWLFQIDSDDEIGPESFPELWRRRHDYDFLLGRRIGRRAQRVRQVISLVSRLVVHLCYGRGVHDVNSPYRLMRTAAFKDIFFAIPEDTFAPNLLVSGLAARNGLRCYETGVPYRFRRTGAPSIVGLKLVKNVFKAFWQAVRFRLRSGQV